LSNKSIFNIFIQSFVVIIYNECQFHINRLLVRLGFIANKQTNMSLGSSLLRIVSHYSQFCN